MRVNPKWQEKMEKQITAHLDALKQGFAVVPKIEETSNYNPATQWLIMRLAKENIGFRLIQLGAGVKKVTTETEVCPKCNGTGRC